MAISALNDYRTSNRLNASAIGPGKRLFYLTSFGRVIFVILVCCLFLTCEASAALSDLRDDEITVSLMTMGPGDAVYEKFGHNAIWVHSKEIAYRRVGNGFDIPQDSSKTFNYGLFSFEEENFIWRFIRGRMEYWMDAEPAYKCAQDYIEQRRSVWIQDLDLTPAQIHRIREILDEQVQKKYRYDYYTANCSTRVRDALDAAVGGQIREQLEGKASGVTFRYDTRRLMSGDVLLYTGLYFILGHAVDRPISAWDECYLPEKLKDYLAEVKITDEQGHVRPLVKHTEFLHQSDRPAEAAAPPNWTLGYLLFGIGVGGVLVQLAYFAAKHWSIRLALAGISAIWLFVMAFAGSFACFAWLCTSHAAAYRNENILQFSPLAVPLLVLVPGAAFGKRSWSKYALWIAAAMLALAVLGLSLKILPGFYQDNWQMVALALPAHAGLLLAAFFLLRQRTRLTPAQPVSDARRGPGAAKGRKREGNAKGC